MSMLSRFVVKAAKELAERDAKPLAAKRAAPKPRAVAKAVTTPRVAAPAPRAAAPKRVVKKPAYTVQKPASESQAELFPGYAAQHREARKAKFLEGTQTLPARLSSRDTTPQAPLTLYHSTTAPEFDAFRTHGTGKVSTSLVEYETPRQGIFMAEDPRVSEYFISDDKGGYLPGGRMMPLHASLKNPFYMTDSHISDLLDDTAAIDRFQQAGINLRGLYHIPHYWEAFDAAPGAEDDFVGQLRGLGYDSAYFEEPTSHMDVPSDINPGVWVAFDPTQVKSATGNIGSFSPDEPSIKKARGGLAVKRRRK